MSLQQSEVVGLGEIKVSANKMTVFSVPNLGTGVALTIFDKLNVIGGVAYVVLPESSLDGSYTSESLPGKYANLAVPKLLEEFAALGGEKRSCVIRMVGGAQLFNFGGGGGNILNIGARNATAIRAALSKQGFPIERADTGGNKGKTLRFVMATGQLLVAPIGGNEYIL